MNRTGFVGGRFVGDPRCNAGQLKLGIIGGLGLGRRAVPDRLEEAAFIEPVDPFEGGELDRFEAASTAASMDHLGFVEAVDGLGESIVVAVADAADRGLDARLGEPLGIFDRDVLHTAIAVVDEAATADAKTRQIGSIPWMARCSLIKSIMA